jgi:DNA repair exonuclease SbcCD nuclease subunit
MKPLYVTSDLHLGAERVSGTVPLTRSKLKQDLLAGYADILLKSSGSLLINGDWLDTDKIALADLLEVYRMTSAWLGGNDKLYAARGNHDSANNRQVLSSFDLLCLLLQSTHGDKVVIINDTAAIPEYNAYIIASSQNQDAFDSAIASVPPCETLFLHCNVANKFAVASLHSLNLSEEQIQKLPVTRIVAGHEHHRRELSRGKVHIPGCPLPSSVADCLGPDKKYMVKLSGAGLEYIETWQANGDFDQQDWRSLQDTGARFIRVIGNATYAEAAEVVSAISKFRSKSEALVITNAVVVEGISDQAELEITAEKMAAFDVKAALFSILDPEEVAVVTQLLEGENV